MINGMDLLSIGSRLEQARDVGQLLAAGLLGKGLILMVRLDFAGESGPLIGFGHCVHRFISYANLCGKDNLVEHFPV